MLALLLGILDGVFVDSFYINPNYGKNQQFLVFALQPGFIPTHTDSTGHKHLFKIIYFFT